MRKPNTILLNVKHIFSVTELLSRIFLAKILKFVYIYTSPFIMSTNKWNVIDHVFFLRQKHTMYSNMLSAEHEMRTNFSLFYNKFVCTSVLVAYLSFVSENMTKVTWKRGWHLINKNKQKKNHDECKN